MKLLSPVKICVFTVLLIGGFVTTQMRSPDAASPLLYSTYLGGSRSDDAYSIVVDDQGYAYIGGSTMSTDFPVTPGAYDTTFGGGYVDSDAFIAKLQPQGNALVYATFLGGSSSDTVSSIAVDEAGNVYLTGTTWSTDFPTTSGSFQPTSPGGSSNAFVAKLDSQGRSLLYSTFLGGAQADSAAAIAIDASGDAYVTGSTGSADFPTTSGAFNVALAGGSDAFVAKLNPSGSNLIYGTYLGGVDTDSGLAIALDATNSVHVAGVTNGMPTSLGAYDSSYGGGGDAFIAVLTPAGDRLTYSTLLGGRDWDQVSSIALDSSGNTFITGYTFSTDFPTTVGSFGTIFKGGSESFVTKLRPDGSGLVYSKLISGNQQDQGFAVTVDSAGNAYVVGTTSSTDFPTTSGAYNPNYVGGPGSAPYDAFVARLNPEATSLTYSTFLGGNGLDSGRSMFLGQSGEIYVTGSTSAADFPVTTGAFDTTYGGTQYDSDAFVTKLLLDSTSGNASGGLGIPAPILWAVLILGTGGGIIGVALFYRRMRRHRILSEKGVPPLPA